jgi:hypothetical protein
MTLVEFIAPLKGKPNRDICLAVLYYKHRYEQVEALTVEQIRASMMGARVRGARQINVADVLAKSGHYVDSAGVVGTRRQWKLTGAGEQHVRSLLGLPESEPEIEHDVASLTELAQKLPDSEVRKYVEEAIKCLGVGALRAAVVFLWTGAIRTLQDKALSVGVSQLNAAILKHDSKARHVGKLDDFEYIKDKVTLLAVEAVGIVDKGERSTLEEALNLRNRCGHPTKYNPGIKKASSFVEDIMSVVFS